VGVALGLEEEVAKAADLTSRRGAATGFFGYYPVANTALYSWR